MYFWIFFNKIPKPFIRITFIATIFALRVAFNLFPGVSATDIVVLHDPVVGTVEVTASVSITFSDGFIAQPGCSFYAYIDPSQHSELNRLTHRSPKTSGRSPCRDRTYDEFHFRN